MLFRSQIKKDALRPKVSLNAQDIVYAEALIERMYTEFFLKPLGFEDDICLSGGILITLLARSYLEEENPSLIFTNNKDLVLHCVEYIRNNFADPITLEEMTKMSMMTKNSFCQIFKDITGCTFKEFLNQCRIKKGAELIKEGHKASAVALMCGYSDFSTFYRNFSKIMGVSPSKYK